VVGTRRSGEKQDGLEVTWTLEEDQMRRIILLIMIGVLAPVIAAAGTVQPLNVKTGLWETTMTTQITGMPPIPPEVLNKMTPERRAKVEAAMKERASQGPQTHTGKRCVTQEELNKGPFGDKMKSCTQTVLNSTGQKMEIHEVCTAGDTKTDVTFQIEALSSESVKGAGRVAVTRGGRTMNAETSLTAKWIGAACTGKE
jgi:Protein of unknown function (DUF3617)